MAPTTKTRAATPAEPDTQPDAVADPLAEAMAEWPAWEPDVPGPSLLAWKTSAVMGEVHRVRKTGRNTQQQYDFAKEGDIADMVRLLLAKYQVGFRGSVISVTRNVITSRAGNAGTEAIVRMQLTLTCATTGEVEESYWEGDATDFTDKAVPKAITACKKSWLIFRFLISTGDEEADAGGEEFQRSGYQAAPTSQPRQQQQPSGPDTRPVTSGQISRLFALSRNVPFLYRDGQVDKGAVHDLARWTLRKDDAPNPVESLNDLTRDEVQRIFNVVEKCADPEQAGAVAAAIDEWLTSMGTGDAPEPPTSDGDELPA